MFWFMVLALGIAAYALTGGASVFKAGTRVLFTVQSPASWVEPMVWVEFSRMFPGAALVTGMVEKTPGVWAFGTSFQHDVAKGNIPPVFAGSQLALISVSSGLPAS